MGVGLEAILVIFGEKRSFVRFFKKITCRPRSGTIQVITKSPLVHILQKLLERVL
jgi:hypothetical protein